MNLRASDIHNPRILAAIPAPMPGVEARPDATGRLQLRAELPPATGAAAWFARRLGFRRHPRILLDDRGTRFWREIDGQRPLAGIAAALAREWNVDAAAARVAVFQFTAALMRRGFLGLTVTPPDPAKIPSPPRAQAPEGRAAGTAQEAVP